MCAAKLVLGFIPLLCVFAELQDDIPGAAFAQVNATANVEPVECSRSETCPLTLSSFLQVHLGDRNQVEPSSQSVPKCVLKPEHAENGGSLNLGEEHILLPISTLCESCEPINDKLSLKKCKSNIESIKDDDCDKYCMPMEEEEEGEKKFNDLKKLYHDSDATKADILKNIQELGASVSDVTLRKQIEEFVFNDLKDLYHDSDATKADILKNIQELGASVSDVTLRKQIEEFVEQQLDMVKKLQILGVDDVWINIANKQPQTAANKASQELLVVGAPLIKATVEPERMVKNRMVKNRLDAFREKQDDMNYGWKEMKDGTLALIEGNSIVKQKDDWVGMPVVLANGQKLMWVDSKGNQLEVRVDTKVEGRMQKNLNTQAEAWEAINDALKELEKKNYDQICEPQCNFD